MVLKRQLPSRVAPDAASTPSAGNAAPKPNIDEQWPAPPAETPAAPAAEIPALPPLPSLPPLEAFSAPAPEAPQPVFEAPAAPQPEAAPASVFEQPVQAEAAPEQPAPAPRPTTPADTTPSLPSDEMPRRRVKAPRAFTTEAPAPQAAQAALPPAPVENPIAEAPDRLASAGIIETAPADPLTVNNPAALPSVAAPVEQPAPQVEAPLPAVAQTVVVAEPQAAPQPVENIFVPADLPPEIASFGTKPEPAPQPAKAEVPVAAPAPAVAATQTPELPAAASDLPWATTPEPQATSNDGGWDIDPLPTPEGEKPAAPVSGSPTPPPDVFRDVAVSRSAESPIPTMPWSTSGSGRPAPELPTSSLPVSQPRGGSFQLILAAAVVAGVIFAAYYMVSNSGSGRTQEQIARLTGSLRQAPEVVPGSPSSTNPAVQPNLQPEKIVAMNNLSGSILPPPAVATNSAATFNPLPTTPATSSSAVIDFADVPPSEANKPIVADGTEKMPEDVGFVASLQQAIAKEKAKQSGQAGSQTPGAPTVASKDDGKNLTQEQKIRRGEDLKNQLDEELAAYRKALLDSPAPVLSPKPTDFLKNDKPYMDGNKKSDTQLAATTSGTLLMPPAANAGSKTGASAKQGVEGLPPAELYAHNPKNLPVLPEPSTAEPPKVRQLADFDVNVFEPETQKVRMPKGVKPNLAAGDFPSMDILSLVPGRGLIAFYEGKEGVLMVGEKIAGWKLIGVNSTSAEFSSGEKHQVVRPD